LIIGDEKMGRKYVFITLPKPMYAKLKELGDPSEIVNEAVKKRLQQLNR
jgi:hypothetical protein